MEKLKNSFQLKEQKKMLPKIYNETEANNLPDKESKALVIKFASELREGDEHNGNFIKKLYHMF